MVMLQQLKTRLFTKAPAAPERLLVNAYITTNDVADMTFPHHVHGQRSMPDAGLADHLEGFMAYVQSRGDGTMTATRYHVLRHLQRTRHQRSFDIAERDLDAVGDWAERVNALLFLPDGHVRDPRGRVLVSAQDGAADAAATVPYPADTEERQVRIGAAIAARGYKVPAHLPPVVGASEVQWRDPQVVAGRAMALFLVALKAEVVTTAIAATSRELAAMLPLALPHLSPAEQAFFDTEAPSVAASTPFLWRYESLFVLAWALKWVDTLPFPDAICDVPRLASAIRAHHQADILRSATLRPAHAMLDALDLHYRLHWRVRQCAADGQPVPPGLDGSVIFERHYALNWLVQLDDSAWDDVDTPT